MAVEDLNLTQMEVAAEDIIEGPDTQVPTVELPPSYSVDGVDVSARAAELRNPLREQPCPLLNSEILPINNLRKGKDHSRD